MDFTEKVYPTALEAATYDEKSYGYPANVEYLGVFYNKQMFKDAESKKFRKQEMNSKQHARSWKSPA